VLIIGSGLSLVGSAGGKFTHGRQGEEIFCRVDKKFPHLAIPDLPQKTDLNSPEGACEKRYRFPTVG
jgi:hypothetical protein